MSTVVAPKRLYLNRELHEQLIIKVARVVNQMSNDSKAKSLLASLKWLDQVQFVEFVLDPSADKKPQRMHLSCLECDLCGSVVHNLLLFLIHLHTTHETDSLVYEISDSEEVLFVIKNSKMQKKEHVEPGNPFESQYIDDYYSRLSSILVSIFSKVNRRDLEKSGHVFYHSTNPFQEIVQSETDSEEVYDVVHHNQSKRLQEFTDVSKQEIQFFTTWNNFVRRLQKVRKNGVFGREYIISNLKEFVKIKEVSSLRVQLITHLNALWCYGLLHSNQIIELILEYDRQQKLVKTI